MSLILIIEIKKDLVLIFTSTCKVPSEKLTFLFKLITIKADIGITILENFLSSRSSYLFQIEQLVIVITI
jgi:hypothetical protein